jgi:hypothetical protein
VQAYHQRFPEKIRLILSERNIASNAIVAPLKTSRLQQNNT